MREHEVPLTLTLTLTNPSFPASSEAQLLLHSVCFFRPSPADLAASSWLISYDFLTLTNFGLV